MKKIFGLIISILGSCGFIFLLFLFLMGLFYGPSARTTLVVDFGHLMILIGLLSAAFISYIVTIIGIAIYSEWMKKIFLKIIILGGGFFSVVTIVILLSYYSQNFDNLLRKFIISMFWF